MNFPAGHVMCHTFDEVTVYMIILAATEDQVEMYWPSTGRRSKMDRSAVEANSDKYTIEKWTADRIEEVMGGEAASVANSAFQGAKA